MRRLTITLCTLGLLAGAAAAEEMSYVIKVTPSLVYLDAGAHKGARIGQAYMVLHAEEDGESYSEIGDVRIIRLFEEFSIAEIIYQVEGEEFEVLQRAVSSEVWQEMGGMGVEMSMARKSKKTERSVSSRSIVFLAGGDWSKATTDLRYFGNSLVGVGETGGAGLGVRLSNVFGEKWRLNFTYRISGEVLGAGDVTQLSLEADLHYILRGKALASPYLGLGLGMHQLSWDAPPTAEDSGNEVGANLMGGVQVPVGDGGWSWLVEGGYQRVIKWDALINASNVRTHVGLVRNF